MEKKMEGLDADGSATASSAGEIRAEIFSDAALAEYRAAHVPLYNAQPLKLGLFAVNLSNHVLCSSVPTTFEVSWRHSRTLAQQVDRMGLEIIVPAARWLGYGGETDFHARTFETLTYAAGLLASTKNVMVFSTIHASLINPVVAAKAIVTLDHISNGRAGLNIVMGWYAKEMEMLGIELREHANRYEYGGEWIEIIERIWQENAPFDFNGDYFKLKGVEGKPKPIQPRPVLINAGASPAGIEFSARHADFNFTIFDTEDHATRYVNKIREKAWDQHRRKIGMLTTVVVVCRDTEEEAKAAFRSIVDHADWVAAENYLAGQNANLDGLDEQERAAFMEKFAASAASQPLVGTPEQVVEGFASIKRAGIDGVLIGLIDYAEELKYFEERVLPLMKQKGLRI
jgi:FMNH2-dependent dimethyl sulfone monooxygenase